MRAYFNFKIIKMKFPTHIILDWNSTNVFNSSQYWLFKYLNKNKNLTIHEPFFYFLAHKKFFEKKNTLFKNKLLKNAQIYTLKYKQTKLSNSIILPKSKNPQFNSKNKSTPINNKFITNFYKFFSLKTDCSVSTNNALWNAFDINFLKKEKIYTKLKYSRVPQYDIVSGGVAALFAGFLGFLICEKFGFELLDSGDFYVFVMYLVFFNFFVRLFIKLFSTHYHTWSNLSIKWFFFYYKNLLWLFFFFIKNNIYKK